ncbi:MAG: hypothetical protein KDK39_04365 [Leptospiraceae bacterium]|nr:hypothetical protein [Leptospiraceae bacterium]
MRGLRIGAVSGWRCARRALKAAPGLLLLSGLIHCSTPYLKNRLHDAADIVTIEGQRDSYGAALHAGPLALGVAWKSQQYQAIGLRGGEWGAYNSAGFTALAFGSDYFTEQPVDFNQEWKSKLQKSTVDTHESVLERGAGASINLTTNNAIGLETLPIDTAEPSLARQRGKTYRLRLPFGTVQPAYTSKTLLKDDKIEWAPAWFYTRLELQAGAWLGFRAGFNVGELLDFLVGWTTVDLYNDDAPYEPDLEERFLNDPRFKNLPPHIKAALLEQIRKNGSLPVLP